MINDFQRAERPSGASSSWHLGLYPEDAAIIDGALGQALNNLELRKSAQQRAARLHALGAWLKENGRESMAGRLNRSDKEDFALRDDVLAFKLTGSRLYDPDLAHLRNSLKLVEANHALELEAREQPALPSGLGAGQPSPSQALPATPASPSEGAWALLRKEMQERASPSTARAPSDTYAGLEPFVDLNAPTPSELHDDAHFSPAHAAGTRSDTYAGLEPLVDLNGPTPSELDDEVDSARAFPALPCDAQIRGLDPTARSRGPGLVPPQNAPAPSSDIYRGLQSFVDLPYTPQEMRDDAQSAPVLSPAGRPSLFIGQSGAPQKLQDIWHLLDAQHWQHGSQPVPDALLGVLNNNGLLPTQFSGPTQVLINGETYSIALGPRGRGAQFIHHPHPSPVPRAQIGPSVTGASSVNHSGRVLGPRQWLGDEHIERDYDLLRRELQESNPDLAARMRFVDPLIAQMLRSGSNEGAERAFGWIRGDKADFLFLPVSDASAADGERRGSHWSLLLVDRRDRARPVAYHYDSARGYNDRPAAMLAAQVGANLQDAPISQQRNTYDCGVFVVDGTRELVRRLAERYPDPLNLNDLRINRPALQNRLRG